MRIVHLGPTSLPIGYRQGGAVERRMAELAAAQVARGHQVLLISVAPEHADDRSPAAIDPAVELHDVPCRTRRPVRDLEFLARARTAVRRFSPDVVHVHNNWAGAVMLHGIDAPKVLSVDFFRYRGS